MIKLNIPISKYIVGCLGLTGFFTPKAWVSQDVYMHLRYKRMNNWYLNDVNHVCKYCKKISEDAIYSEYYNNTISPRTAATGIIVITLVR
jgi:hypothetical protein